jgi:hypothetical protein
MPFDPDFGKTGFARDLFRLRFRGLKIDQATFANRFGLTFGNVRDLEQSRRQPIAAIRVLVAAIEMDPGLIERAAQEAARRWPDKCKVYEPRPRPDWLPMSRDAKRKTAATSSI